MIHNNNYNYNNQPQKAIFYNNNMNNQQNNNNNINYNNNKLSNSYQNFNHQMNNSFNLNNNNNNLSNTYQNLNNSFNLNNSNNNFNNYQNNNMNNQNNNMNNRQNNNVNYNNYNRINNISNNGLSKSYQNFNYPNLNNNFYLNNSNNRTYPNNNFNKYQNNNINYNNNYNNMNNQLNNNNLNFYYEIFGAYIQLFPGRACNQNIINDMIYDYNLMNNIQQQLEDFSRGALYCFSTRNLRDDQKIEFLNTFYQELVFKLLSKHQSNPSVHDLRTKYELSAYNTKNNPYEYCNRYGLNQNQVLKLQTMSSVFYYVYLRLLFEGKFIKNILNLQKNLSDFTEPLPETLFSNGNLSNSLNLILSNTKTCFGEKFETMCNIITQKIINDFNFYLNIKTKLYNINKKNKFNNQNITYNQQMMNNNFNQNFNRIQQLNFPVQEMKSYGELNEQAKTIFNELYPLRAKIEQNARVERKNVFDMYLENCYKILKNLRKNLDYYKLKYDDIKQIDHKLTLHNTNYNYYVNTPENKFNLENSIVEIFVFLVYLQSSDDSRMKHKIKEELNKSKIYIEDFMNPFNHLEQDVQEIISRATEKIYTAYDF